MIRWLLDWWRKRQIAQAEVDHVEALLLADTALWRQALDLRWSERSSALRLSSTADEAARRCEAADAEFHAREEYRRSLWRVPAGALSLADQAGGALSVAP